MGDDSVFKKYGDQLGLVGTWWSGQEHRVLSGIDGVLLVVHASHTPKSTARATTDDLLDAGINLLGVVLNGYSYPGARP